MNKRMDDNMMDTLVDTPLDTPVDTPPDSKTEAPKPKPVNSEEEEELSPEDMEKTEALFQHFMDDLISKPCTANVFKEFTMGVRRMNETIDAFMEAEDSVDTDLMKLAVILDMASTAYNKLGERMKSMYKEIQRRRIAERIAGEVVAELSKGLGAPAGAPKAGEDACECCPPNKNTPFAGFFAHMASGQGAASASDASKAPRAKPSRAPKAAATKTPSPAVAPPTPEVEAPKKKMVMKKK